MAPPQRGAKEVLEGKKKMGSGTLRAGLALNNPRWPAPRWTSTLSKTQ
jgi:hypothetical protein